MRFLNISSLSIFPCLILWIMCFNLQCQSLNISYSYCLFGQSTHWKSVKWLHCIHSIPEACRSMHWSLALHRFKFLPNVRHSSVVLAASYVWNPSQLKTTAIRMTDIYVVTLLQSTSTTLTPHSQKETMPDQHRHLFIFLIRFVTYHPFRVPRVHANI